MTTRYAVCPHCRTVTPMDEAHTISAAAYHVWREMQRKHKPGQRVVVIRLLAVAGVSSPNTLYKYVGELVSAGLVERVAFEPKPVNGVGELRADPNALGEDAPAPPKRPPARAASRHWYRLPEAPEK